MQRGEAFHDDDVGTEISIDDDQRPTLRFRYKRELEMQVRFGDDLPWHRLTIDSAHGFEHGSNRESSKTRCGETMGEYAAYATREESYKGNLCLLGCFGPYEIQLAAEMRRKQSDERRADLEQAEREFFERARAREAEIAAGHERVRVARERAERIQREEAEHERAQRENKEGDDE